MHISDPAAHLERRCAAAWAEDHLHLILMPTEKCNFRCVYCYEDFSIGRMKRPVIEGVKALIDRRAASLSSLDINWFGGEPTLAADIVDEVMRHAQSRAATHGLALSGGMTTNGFLLDAAAYRRFVDLGVTDYQITLDGPAELHDTTRLRANGRGSFATIWNNLLAIRQVPASGDILLRLHVTRRNASGIGDFAAGLERQFGDDPRFRFALQPIENLGGPNDISALVMEREGASWGHRAGLPDQPDRKMEQQPDEQFVCYAAKPNSYVIRADGRVGKCTVALKSDNNCIGRILEDGTMTIDRDKLMPWISGWKTQRMEALACPAVSVFA